MVLSACDISKIISYQLHGSASLYIFYRIVITASVIKEGGGSEGGWSEGGGSKGGGPSFIS